MKTFLVVISLLTVSFSAFADDSIHDQICTVVSYEYSKGPHKGELLIFKADAHAPAQVLSVNYKVTDKMVPETRSALRISMRAIELKNKASGFHRSGRILSVQSPFDRSFYSRNDLTGETVMIGQGVLGQDSKPLHPEGTIVQDPNSVGTYFEGFLSIAPSITKQPNSRTFRTKSGNVIDTISIHCQADVQ